MMFAFALCSYASVGFGGDPKHAVGDIARDYFQVSYNGVAALPQGEWEMYKIDAHVDNKSSRSYSFRLNNNERRKPIYYTYLWSAKTNFGFDGYAVPDVCNRYQTEVDYLYHDIVYAREGGRQNCVGIAKNNQQNGIHAIFWRADKTRGIKAHYFFDTAAYSHRSKAALKGAIAWVKEFTPKVDAAFALRRVPE